MKKILLSLVLISLLAGLVVPMMALALDGAPEGCIMKRNANKALGIGAACPFPPLPAIYEMKYPPIVGPTGAMCCLFSTILHVIDWLFMAIMVIVVILILLGAFTLITASGSEEGVRKGRNYIVFALIGVVVALLARALPYLIRSIMGT